MERYPENFVNTFRRYLHLFGFIGIKIFPDGRRYGVEPKFWIIGPYFVLIFASLLTMAIKTIKDRASIAEIAHSISTTVVMWQGMVKLVVLVGRRESMRHILLGLAQTWSRNEPAGPDLEMTTLINNYLKRLKIYDTVYFSISVLGVMVYQASPVIITAFHWRDVSPTFVLGLSMYYPFDVDTYPKYFAAYLIQILFSVPLYMSVNLSIDMMLAAMTSAVCLQLSLLQLQLRRAVAAGDDLRAVVTQHQVLLELVKQINSTFSAVTFVCTFSASGLICFFLFLSTITSGVDQIKVTMACVVMIINVFNFSWLGQLIFDTCTQTADAAYDSAWYEADQKTKRAITIIIMRSQKPCYLSAAGFSNITLVSASTALSSACSYFSVMRQLYRNLTVEEST